MARLMGGPQEFIWCGGLYWDWNPLITLSQHLTAVFPNLSSKQELLKYFSIPEELIPTRMFTGKKQNLTPHSEGYL
jgi:hypothetical protein